MHRSTRRAAFVCACCLSAAVATPTGAESMLGGFGLNLTPESQTVKLGETVTVTLVTTSFDPEELPFDALDAIVIWDPAVLGAISSSQAESPISELAAGFLNDPDDINDDLDDGDALFTILVSPVVPAFAPISPETVVVTTFSFTAQQITESTEISFLPMLGVFGETRILYQGAEQPVAIGGPIKITVIEPDPCANADHDCLTEGGPGCTDLECCELVCAADSFCCDVEWDSVCVTQAKDLCFPPVCPESDHNCFTEGVAGCTDEACCLAVCAVDPFCCEVEWDVNCVDEAALSCDGCGAPDAGDCCTDTGTPYCDDRTCCETICAADSFCCESTWDQICADAAAIECDVCAPLCPTSDHNCFTEGIAGCTDEACCIAVCTVDPFCCEAEWDVNCVDEAVLSCDGCGAPDAGDCCTANGTPFCDDRTCCETVCAKDVFCCDTEWDEFCAEDAAILCEQCAPVCPGEGGCFVANGSPGCSDAECCDAVCAVDSFCCESEWDAICADEAAEICGDCGGEEAGCCYEENGSIGCNLFECCATVCGADPFCCNTSWDGLCADQAIDLCCPADFNGDGEVDGADLGLLLGAWGTAGPAADLNCDGTVDGADLGILLAAWGPCDPKGP